MIGRAAYHDPAAILGGADALISGENRPAVAPEAAVLAMRPYVEARLAEGARLHQITRHMLGAFAGRRGARRWRQVLSADATAPGAGLEVVTRALAEVAPEAVAAAEAAE
jgi:tRNA-dihydrouridine synthase A